MPAVAPEPPRAGNSGPCRIAHYGAGDRSNRSKDHSTRQGTQCGIADTFLRFREGQGQGTVSFAFIPGHDPGAGFEVWVDREPFGKPNERMRVSKPVTFN